MKIPIAPCLAVMIACFINMAVAQTNPRPYWEQNYSRLPYSDIDKRFIESTYWDLENLKKSIVKVLDAEDYLRSECIGDRANRMLATVRGVKIVATPYVYGKCKESGELVKNGNPYVDYLMKKINKDYGTSYSRPRGNEELSMAWSQAQGTFKSFNKCDEISSKILGSGIDRPEIQAELVSANKAACPKEWVALFQEEEPAKSKNKDGCPPPSPGFVWITPCNDETESELSKDLDALENSESAKDQRKLTSNEENRNKSKGNFKRSAQSSLGNLGANSLNSVPVYGGESGQLLGTILEGAAASEEYGGSSNENGSGANPNTSSNSSCDPVEENSIANDLTREMKSSSVVNAPLDRQQCVVSRVYIKAYERMLSLAQRCNPSKVGEVQAALRDLRRQEQQGCASR